MPIQPGSTTSAQPDPEDLADLDALTEELIKLGLPSLRLIPRNKPPYVDTSPPKSMTPGERIYVQAGMFFWQTAEPIAPSNEPSAAADIIARTLTPGQRR